MTGPDVATRIGGGVSGSVHSRVDSSLKYRPSCFTSLPVNSLAITSIASNMRAMRSGASGQYCPTTCSLSASPDAMPSQCRPGYIAASVAAAWAVCAGWLR